jgi:hypothetical protein
MQVPPSAAITIILLAACAPAPLSDPAHLAAVIAEAAQERDYETLSRHMAGKFSYSFGMPPSREGALERFRQQPALLEKMAQVLEQECASKTIADAHWYICPAAAAAEKVQYYGWRAGFRQTESDTWEFVWFIAGD